MLEASIVIVGGGIAGVSCAEGIGFLAPEEKVIVVSASPLLKAVKNIVPLGKSLIQFDVEEKSSKSLIELFPSVSVINDIVQKVDIVNKQIETKTGTFIKYNKLCVCTGAKPKLIYNHSRVLGIRDTESVETFIKKLEGAQRVVVVGNGGIATELVHEIKGINVVWIIKDKHISATFVDPGAAEFFIQR